MSRSNVRIIDMKGAINKKVSIWLNKFYIVDMINGYCKAIGYYLAITVKRK